MKTDANEQPSRRIWGGYDKNARKREQWPFESLSNVAQAFIAANDEQVAELLASQDVSEVTCDAGNQD